MATKLCTKCDEEKPFSEFTKHKLGRFGLRPRCKACSASENAVYRSKTVEHRAEYNARWKRDHPENHRAYNYAWCERNPEKVSAHRQIRNALRRHELERPEACEKCGAAGDIQAHHPDYSQPLYVAWLCVACHATEGVCEPSRPRS